MSGARRLTKEDILKGKDKHEPLYVEEYDAEVVVRPLTDGELSEIFSHRGSVPLNQDGTPDITRMDVSKNFEALRMAASMGMVEPKLTNEEVSDMKFGVPEYIGTKILEISGVSSPEDAKKKRLALEALIRSPEGQELSALCLDYGYKLADHPGELTRDQINFLIFALSNRLRQISYQQPLEEGTTRIVFE
jgi:hypothetical protein